MVATTVAICELEVSTPQQVSAIPGSWAGADRAQGRAGPANAALAIAECLEAATVATPLDLGEGPS